MEYSSIPGSDLSFTTPNTKQSSSIESVNTPRKSTNNIPETPNLPQKDTNSKESVRRIMESQTFNDNISEKMKIESLKTEIMSSLESTISSLFQKELNTMKDKCEKLIQNSYSNYICQIDNLRKEIENKDEIINKLSTALNNITKNLILKSPTVVLNNKNLLLENAPSNDNDNILPPAGDCSTIVVIFSQPTLRVDNGKAALTLHRLNEYFSELNLDVVNNSNIKVKHIGQKVLHLNPKRKGRLALNFIHKIRDL